MLVLARQVTSEDIDDGSGWSSMCESDIGPDGPEQEGAESGEVHKMSPGGDAAHRLEHAWNKRKRMNQDETG